MHMEDPSFDTGSTPADCAAQAFSSLRLPIHLTLERLVSVVESLRGRPIEIDVADGLNGGSVCGLWLSTDTKEIILHADTASALHRQQFVLHELGHMVLRHDEVGVPADYASSVFPNIPGRMVRRVLMRSSFVDQIEAAAETLADLFAAAIRDSAQEPRSFERVFG
ncbi:ImmA/IrrE family metallo-endopeptidase [Arthrobacter sp. LAR12-1-1.1]